MTQARAFRPGVAADALAIGVLHLEAGRGEKAFDLAAHQRRERRALLDEYRELDAGGAGVQDEDRIVHF